MAMTLIFYNLWLVGKQVSVLCSFFSKALPFIGEKYPDKSHWPIYLSLLIFLSCKTHTNELQSCPFQLHGKCWFNIFFIFSFDAHGYGTIYDISFLSVYFENLQLPINILHQSRYLASLLIFYISLKSSHVYSCVLLDNMTRSHYHLQSTR